MRFFSLSILLAAFCKYNFFRATVHVFRCLNMSFLSAGKTGRVRHLSLDPRGYISLRLALTLIFIALISLPFAVNLSVNFPRVLTIIESAGRKAAISSLRESYFVINKKIVQREESIRLLSEVPGIRDILSGSSSTVPTDILSNRLTGLLKRWFKNQSDVRDVVLFCPDGCEKFKMVRTPSKELKRVATENLGCKRAVARQFKQWNQRRKDPFIVIVENILKYQNGFHSHEPAARIATAVTDCKGRKIGFASVAIDLADLLQRAHFDFLATGSGVFINWSEFHSRDHEHKPGDLFRRFPGLEKVIKEGREAVVKDINGVETAWFPILAYAGPAENLWAGRPVDESQIEDLKKMIILRVAVVTSTALVVILFLVFWLSARIDTCRRELRDALKKLLIDKEPVRLDWKGPVELESLARDMNEMFEKFVSTDLKRREAIARLSDLSSRMRMILDNAAEGIIEINPNNEITFVNRAACKILGFSREELLGNDLHSIIHYMKEDRSQYPEDDCPFCRAIKDGNYHVFKEDVFWKQDGTPLYVEYVTAPVRDSHGKVTGLVMCLRDTSSRKAVEEKAKTFQDQLRQAQKMEAVGTLAGGVAHDFNNLLTAIRGYAELLEMDVGDNPSAARQLTSIREAADRAAALVKQLLAFSRKQVAEKRIIDVNDLLVEQHKMLRRLIGEDVDLEIGTTAEKAAVFADPNMLAQVIMNMVVNARDAMADSSKKRIAISIEKMVLTPEETAETAGRRPGTYVVISISDTGSGIDEQLVERIFDPFFTTKDSDKGTGLGLAVAYGIVEQHQGWIECLSAPGAGTTFKIYLPENYSSADSFQFKRGVSLDREMDSLKQIGRGLTALLLEDDPLVLGITRDMLKALGFNVVSASNMQEAVYLMDRIGQDIGLVISDVVLPDGNGIDFVESILKKRKDIPVLLLSGYMDEKLHMERIRSRKISFLPKPFRINDLQDAVSRILWQ